MLKGQTLWELIDDRVDLTPDALLATDEDMRTVTFGDFAVEAERAAAGLAGYGVGEGTVVSWQVPTWIESLVLVAALSRLGAVQNPILPIYREREVGFCTAQAGSSLMIVPSTFKGFDFEAMATAIAQENGDMGVLVADKALPQGDTAVLPARPENADPEDQPVRWLFYTSGTTADPKGARHTDASIASVAYNMGQRLAVTERDRSALVFPFTHIGGNHLALHRPADRLLAHPDGGLPSHGDSPRSCPGRGSRWRVPARRSTWPISRTRRASRHRCSPRSGASPEAAPPSRLSWSPISVRPSMRRYCRAMG